MKKSGKRKSIYDRVDTGTYNNEPSMTQQDHGGMADVNYIAQQYASGRLPYPEVPPPQFADVSQIDVQASRDLWADVQSAFHELPSEARDYFANDPTAYVGYLEENAADIAESGLKEHLWNTINPPEPEVEADLEADLRKKAQESGGKSETTTESTTPEHS